MGNKFCSNCSLPTPDTDLTSQGYQVILHLNKKQIEQNIYSETNVSPVKAGSKLYAINNNNGNNFSFSFTKKQTEDESKDESTKLTVITKKNKVNIIIKAFRAFLQHKKSINVNNNRRISTTNENTSKTNQYVYISIIFTIQSSFAGTSFVINGILPNNEGVYLGNLKNAKKDGFGITTWQKDSSLRISTLKSLHYQNEANGFGIFETYSKSNNILLLSFKGEFIKNKANGYGLYTLYKGGLYEGEWSCDLQSGIGEETWPDGSSYKGQYYKGKKNGLGTYIWKDGSKYQGELVQNSFEGYGIYTFKDGRVYMGEWRNSTMNGYGEMIYKDGKIYIGYSVNNKKEGFGMLIWKQKGKAYIGFWKENNQNGIGKFVNLKGSKYGRWNKGTQERVFTEEEFYNALNRSGLNQYAHYFTYGYKALEMYLQFFKMD